MTTGLGQRSQSNSLPSDLDVPVPRTARGTVRRVGLEIEFTGLDVQTAAEALVRELGGEVVREDACAFLARGTRLGDLGLELDLRHLHPRRREPMRLPRLGPRSAAVLGCLVERFVPRELITAPLPMDRVVQVDAAIAALRRAGAGGRGVTAFASLGLHLNIEAPSLAAEPVTRMLKAYLLAEPWLREGAWRGRGSWMVRPPAPFPDAFVRRVLAPDYWPDLPNLLDDYLSANPTRDRGLDLLPLLSFLDEAAVRRRLPFEKIRARPAFHYRLPLAHVGDPDWSVQPDWERWIAVERLAADQAALEELGRSFLADRQCGDGGARLYDPAVFPGNPGLCGRGVRAANSCG